MSNFSNILRLYPPLADSHTEHLQPDVTFPCPHCSGNGWHWRRLENETYKHPCRHCNGSGKLKAKVIIDWEPGGEPVPIFDKGETE